MIAERWEAGYRFTYAFEHASIETIIRLHGMLMEISDAGEPLFQKDDSIRIFSSVIGVARSGQDEILPRKEVESILREQFDASDTLRDMIVEWSAHVTRDCLEFVLKLGSWANRKPQPLGAHAKAAFEQYADHPAGVLQCISAQLLDQIEQFEKAFHMKRENVTVRRARLLFHNSESEWPKSSLN